jgi:hypothetical protein
MTSLDRANRFLSNKSRAIALSIVPLAGLAISYTPAAASVSDQLTAFNPGRCVVSATVANVSVTGDNCADAAQGAPDSGGLLGVKVYSENSSFESSPISAFSSSGGTFGLEIFASGGTTGNTFGGTIPVSWDFSVTTGDGGDFAHQLFYDISGSPDNSFSTGSLSSFTNASGSTISGTNSLNLSTGTIITGGYEIELRVAESTNCCSKSLTVNVPTNSLDLAPSTATPEPGSVFLFGSGFAGMLLRRFRRMRR